MSFDLNEYKKLYLITASDKLSEMTKLLSAIEINHNPKAISDFHRQAHSIKSQSFIMGYAQLGLAGKILESLFRAVKEARITLNPVLIQKVRQMINAMSLSLQNIQDQLGEFNLSKEIRSLEDYTEIRLSDP